MTKFEVLPRVDNFDTVGERPLDFLPLSWRSRFSMEGADIALTASGPGGKSFEMPFTYFIIMLTPQPERKFRINSDKWTEYSAPAGAIEVVPNGVDYAAKWATYKESFILGLNCDWLNVFMQREFDTGELRTNSFEIGSVYPEISQIARLLQAKWQKPLPATRLYHESLVMALLVSLIRASVEVNIKSSHDHYKGGLTLRTEKLVRDYMHEHQGRNIGIAELADVAGLSYSHFLRAFRQTHGVPPSKMLRTIRLHSAQDLLLHSTLSIREIASRVGFANQSHMTSAMKMDLGSTPGEIRRLKDA